MSTQLGSEPAYPCKAQSFTPERGFTKREVLAAMAMQGLLANSRHFAWRMDAERVAEVAVEHADALLAELAKEERT